MELKKIIIWGDMRKLLHKNKMYLQERLQKLNQDFTLAVASNLRSGNRTLNEKTNAYNELENFNPDQLEFVDYLISQGLDKVPKLVQKQYQQMTENKGSLKLESFRDNREMLSRPETIEVVLFRQDDKVGLLLPVNYEQERKDSKVDYQKSLLVYSARCFGESRINSISNIPDFEGFVRVHGTPEKSLNESAENLIKRLSNGEVPNFREGNLNLYVSDLGYFSFPMPTLLITDDFCQKVSSKYNIDPIGEYNIREAEKMLGLTRGILYRKERGKTLVTPMSKNFEYHGRGGKHSKIGTVKGSDLLNFAVGLEKGEITIGKRIKK